MITFKEFNQASATVDKIVQDDFDITNVRTELEESASGIAPEEKRNFYGHMSRLFLNVMVNRLNELGENAKQYAIIARQIITELVQKEEKYV